MAEEDKTELTRLRRRDIADTFIAIKILMVIGDKSTLTDQEKRILHQIEEKINVLTESLSKG